MRDDIQRAIDKIVEIINEAANCGGMSREDTEALRSALGDLVAATLRTIR